MIEKFLNLKKLYPNIFLHHLKSNTFNPAAFMLKDK